MPPLSRKPARRRGIFAFGTILLAAGLFLSVAPVSGASETTTPAIDCTKTTTPVSLTENGPVQYQVSGELCRPAGSDSSLVQVLLPGATYNHNYWDLPYQPENYSYVQHMNEAGHTTFNIDRIGTGASSHPLSALVSVPSNAVVVHHLVQKLRAGEITGTPFQKVVLVGHSLGTLIGMSEVSRYKDVDGFIATGILHTLNLTFAPDLNTLLYPARLDPRFSDRDPGYLTSRPGARGGPLFFADGQFDPGALAADEESARDTVTDVELGLFPQPILDGTATGVTVPTMIVMGERDKIFCGGVGGADCSSAETIYAHEKPHYPNADLTTFVQPGSGHCNNIHFGARDWYAAAASWLSTTFPEA